MTPLDAFNWAFDRITRDHQTIHRAEEKRLDPPSDGPLIDCYFCDARGYFKQRHCAGQGCNFLRYCPCECQACQYVECDVCSGAGEFCEPAMFEEKDAYYEAKWDEAKERRESGGAA
jgi:hypothetical protein